MSRMPVIAISLISIHPPLAGRDAVLPNAWCSRRISIHPPLAGRDSETSTRQSTSRQFQSTRPLRDGTRCTGMRQVTLQFQSTRPLRDGTALKAVYNKCTEQFQSTRPLRDGTSSMQPSRRSVSFQSTRPLRDGTNKISGDTPFTWLISIHPPLAGRD